MTLENILTMPQVLNNIHESSYRAYHILDKVLEMVERGDSPESIAQVARLLKFADYTDNKKPKVENG